jgi:flagellar basal-body rod modification protein FlgD
MTTPITNQSTTTATQNSTTSSRASLAQNFDTFLTLLTAQLQNQDPLDPVDSSKFTDQLVQFSQVEQQIETNDRISRLLESQAASSAGAAIGYIGRTAEVKGATTQLADDEARWGYQLERAASEVKLTVTDNVGRIVFETQRSGATGMQSFVWDGRDLDGRERPAGAYRLTVSAVDAAGENVPATISVREKITGVDLAGGSTQFMTNNGQRGFSDILRILE